MRLQKHIGKKVGTKEYAKWVIVIPSQAIKDSELKEGDELDVKAGSKKLTISKK